jgi:hypothetical protein
MGSGEVRQADKSILGMPVSLIPYLALLHVAEDDSIASYWITKLQRRD